MNAEHKIKRQVLISLMSKNDIADHGGFDLNTIDGIDDAYDQAGEYEGVFDFVEIIDEMEDFRCGGRSTNLKGSEYSRCYESERVAVELDDGAFVSWVYWTGGGKHGEPGAIDWIDDAIFVDCEKKQELVTTYAFSLKNDD